MPDKPQTNFEIPVTEVRALPVPYEETGEQRSKMWSLYVPIEELPRGWNEWMNVNPRQPELNAAGELSNPVAKAMIRTLQKKPETFALKNQGIWILASSVSLSSGKRGVLRVILDDTDFHGLVNGGHTFMAIQQFLKARATHKAKDFSGAYVRLHILEGIEDPELIVQLAEGLNRSTQVQDRSLADLEGHYRPIREAMQGKKGESEIAYYQGDDGNMNIDEVVQYLNLFDRDRYPRSEHPNDIFGHPKEALRRYIESHTDPKKTALKTLVPHVQEILVLSEMIKQQAFRDHPERLSKLRISQSPTQNRSASPKHKQIPALFIDGNIGGKFMLGWLFPMLAAFRANMSETAWEQGKVEWKQPFETLVPKVLKELVTTICEAHTSHKEKPAEVGRREAYYRACYGIVDSQILRDELENR